MRLKNKRPISKETLSIGLGLSNSTIEKAIFELIKGNLIKKENNLYYRNINFVFPNVVISGYEAKLTDYNKALYQALMNKEFVDYSYMVFPLAVANNILKKHKDIIESNDLGLIGVSDSTIVTLIKPNKSLALLNYLIYFLIAPHDYLKNLSIPVFFSPIPSLV